MLQAQSATLCTPPAMRHVHRVMRAVFCALGAVRDAALAPHRIVLASYVQGADTRAASFPPPSSAFWACTL